MVFQTTVVKRQCSGQKTFLVFFDRYVFAAFRHRSCVLDGLTTMNKFSAPRIIRYSMSKHEKQIY